MKKLIQKELLTANVTDFALGYDMVKKHTWYDNLNYLIDLSNQYFNNDSLIMDYSCGTGIFLEKLHDKKLFPNVCMMDPSLKYLKLCYEKFKNDENVFFRFLDIKNQSIEESLQDNVFFDGIICANAVHLFSDVQSTFKSWNNILKKGGKVLINSGNIYNPLMSGDTKLIEQTVNDIAELSYQIVKNNSKYKKYIDLLDNKEYISKHDLLREKYFLPIRNIDFYTNQLVNNGFKIIEVKTIDVNAKVNEWFDFLKVYHEGVIGWIGGSKKITNCEALDIEINDRIEIIREALNIMFDNNDFKACWNYIICEKL